MWRVGDADEGHEGRWTLRPWRGARSAAQAGGRDLGARSAHIAG